MDRYEIQTACNVLDNLREVTWSQEKQVKDMLDKLERETFDGKSYREYVSGLNIEEEVEGVSVRVDRHEIWASLVLGDTTISANTTVYKDHHYTWRIHYPKKTVSEVPKKYEEKIELIRNVCERYIVENPAEEFEKKYRISRW